MCQEDALDTVRGAPEAKETIGTGGRKTRNKNGRWWRQEATNRACRASRHTMLAHELGSPLRHSVMNRGSRRAAKGGVRIAAERLEALGALGAP